MNKFLKEKFKIFILGTLVIISFMQIGILWGYQFHGFPIAFIKGFFESDGYSSNNELETLKNQIFYPYRTIVSEGFDGSYWILPRKDKNTEKIWNEAKWYIEEIVSNGDKIIKSEKIEEKEWVNQIEKEAIIFEFKSKLSKNIIKWFLGKLGNENSKFEYLKKIAIIPWDESTGSNNNLMCVYILDENKINKFIVKINEDNMNKDEFDEIVDKCKNNSKLREYDISGKFFKKSDDIFQIKKDVLISIKGKKEENIRNINVSIPQKIFDLEEISNIVLGRRKEEFVIYYGNNKEVVFQGLDRVYKITSDGFINYENKENRVIKEKQNDYLALERSFEFLKDLKDVIIQKDLYLSNIIEENGCYCFEFDIFYEEYPICIDYNRNREKVRNSIVIKADNRNVLKAQLLVREYSNSMIKNKFNLNFENFLELTNKNEGLTDDIYISYVLSESSKMTLEPVWCQSINDKLLFKSMNKETK